MSLEINKDNNIDKINNINWHDWTFDDFKIDYDIVLVRVTDDLDWSAIFYCKDFIGFSFIGHWDESTIESISVKANGTLIDESIHVIKKLYGDNPQPGGGTKKIDDSWYQINIKLIDGNIIKIVSKEIRVEFIKNKK